MSTREQLLKEIHEFLAETGMKPSTFGEKAMRDRTLVRSLRGTRRDLKSATVDKIRQFISDQRAQRGGSKRRRTSLAIEVVA